MPSAVLGLRVAQDREVFVSTAGHDGPARVSRGRRRAGGIHYRLRGIDAWRGTVRTPPRVHYRDETAISRSNVGGAALCRFSGQQRVRVGVGRGFLNLASSRYAE